VSHNGGGCKARLGRVTRQNAVLRDLAENIIASTVKYVLCCTLTEIGSYHSTLLYIRYLTKIEVLLLLFIIILIYITYKEVAKIKLFVLIYILLFIFIFIIRFLLKYYIYIFLIFKYN
jgi:hypothetical protein